MSKLDSLVSELAQLRRQIRQCAEDVKDADKPYLDELAAIQARARRETEEVIERMNAAHSKAEYSSLIQSADEMKSREDALVREIELEAIHAWCQNTDNKHPASGVSIIARKKLVYSEKAAIEWCAANLTNAVETRLLTRPFEKYARAVADGGKPLEFVELVPAPECRIDTDSINYE